MPPRAAARPASEVLPTAALKAPGLPSGITQVEVRRSARRRSTVSARVEADRIIILLPAHLSAAAEQQWVDKMVQRLADKRTTPAGSDAELAARAVQVASRYLDAAAGHELRPRRCAG